MKIWFFSMVCRRSVDVVLFERIIQHIASAAASATVHGPGARRQTSCINNLDYAD